MERIPEVIDCWVESASMPFAEFHYPFENKEVFKSRFPGQYIAEYIAQTRAWFYYMHVMATLLFDDISFENVVCTGNILNGKGEKLSKSKMNFTDPWKIIETYGVDALRYYLMSSVVMQADDIFFNDNEVKGIYNKLDNTLWNVVVFYEMYGVKNQKSKIKNQNLGVLDKWILAKLQNLVKEVTEGMESYDMTKASRPLVEFIAELSQWYVRRSRDRFKGENSEDAEVATAVLREVLLILSKVMAPFTPFIAEKIYLGITQGKEKESVHLEDWPEVDEKFLFTDDGVLESMQTVKDIVEVGLSIRAEIGIKVRQPLAKIKMFAPVFGSESQQQGYIDIIKDELNIKEAQIILGGQEMIELKDNTEWAVKENNRVFVALNKIITDELKKEGLVREITRTINQIRKEQKLTVSDTVKIEYATDDVLLKSVFADYAEEIKKSVLASDLSEGVDGNEVEIDGKKVQISINK